MGENDIKQMIADAIRENAQERDKPKYAHRQRRGCYNRRRMDFSEWLLIFLSILFFVTWGISKYFHITEGAELSEIKGMLTVLYGAAIGFYQVRRAVESRIIGGNLRPGKNHEEPGGYGDFE